MSQVEHHWFGRPGGVVHALKFVDGKPAHVTRCGRISDSADIPRKLRRRWTCADCWAGLTKRPFENLKP